MLPVVASLYIYIKVYMFTPICQRIQIIDVFRTNTSGLSMQKGGIVIFFF